ncbi:putative vegetative catalase [Rhexocercosporidium sp. MPI-PUGE-AT-0058]|nr:putative vegetative catalase [Rhexocercosporidium sp. MPI-PUGE-AT-0058]
MDQATNAMANVHPLQAIQSAIGSAGGDPRPLQRASLFNNANDGPAKIIAKVSGVQSGGIREDDGPYFTNNECIPFPDPAHSKTIGGLPLASDTFLFQKQQHFNRSKNLERMVHPCGSGAFGYFETTADVSNLTKANFLNGKGVRTPVFMRFSTVTLGREFPDLARNPRGFAVKFYTGEGNYDIVGLNFPVFFCRDPIQGPHVIRSQARNPKNFLLDYNSIFDLLALTPEANHAGMMYFSDHGTPDGWKHNHGYGCHTFKWVNKNGEFVYIKYHFLAKHGQKQFTVDEATRISGVDPDYSKRELWETIERGEEVEWTAYVQIMQPQEADANLLGFDPFDVTKVWPRAQFPLHEFGRLVLNKNPENFHRDVEQAAFSPGSMVPGIEDSPDPLLQFRMFFYRDAQYHRIGNPQYVPNSFKHKFRPDTAESPYIVSDNIVSRKSHFHHEGKLSEYDQARELYTRVMTDSQRHNLHTNTAELLRRVDSKVIKVGYLAQLWNIDPDYARAIYDLLPEVAKSGAEGFEFVDVQNKAKGAELAGKEAKFRPSMPQERLVGFAPEIGVYNL